MVETTVALRSYGDWVGVRYARWEFRLRFILASCWETEAKASHTVHFLEDATCRLGQETPGWVRAQRREAQGWIRLWWRCGD